MVVIKPNRVGPFPFPKSDPEERKNDFSEVEQPYTKEEVMLEADRCLRCGTPVCIDACPVQLDVRGMMDAVANGDFRRAYHRIRETNPLLGVTARCCPQLQGLCEDACVVRWGGQPLSIGMVQRFVADWEQTGSRQPDPGSEPLTGKRVAIVGAGPAGLAAAELLLRYGHSVTIYEEAQNLGGTAWYGIPDYHLPKDVLTYEAERIVAQGAKVVKGVKVGRDISITSLLSESDAILVATGSRDVKKLDTPGSDLDGVLDGYEFLREVYGGGLESYIREKHRNLGKEILVVGGGDTALDCARTALRLTRGHVSILYRRDEKEMPADPIMVKEAQEEGVEFKFLSDPSEYQGLEGKLVGAMVQSMRLGAPDSTGRKRPEPVPGETAIVKCDSVLLAVGRGPDSFLEKKEGLRSGPRGAIAIDARYMTSMAKVFATGDATTGETLVVKAMGHGREAAQMIHEYLVGLEDRHVSLYEQYYTKRATEDSYQDMLSGREVEQPPD
ncbi:MAG: FAD-dependent oxidoreductase [Nitrososphaerota archaeon]|nr:FAD-dependent oxidoreductase [Nitrososphaerota archaeon]MDG6903394.1 FAD-dependent oxidoreductase [Nitrososphaerota archaeon]MDG6911744.1 FAD-dependent oxidoreductase [Nitrososphaerota archaeon]MDG6940774.1 FAD-dependent oxidoreductase [Nitrososphaerota archaeon]MDG6945621.1 FAD-dependent oxidoreductase [Nitrososphaerota archaeon]